MRIAYGIISIDSDFPVLYNFAQCFRNFAEDYA